MDLYSQVISIINIVLCFFIYILGSLLYKENKNKTILYLGVSFGLFGISHIINYLKLTDALYLVSSFIRFAAYLTLIRTMQVKKTTKKTFKYIILFSIVLTFIVNYLPKLQTLFNINIPNEIIQIILNILMTLLIITFSLKRYNKKNNITFLLLSISFTLFLISHTIIFLNFMAYLGDATRIIGIIRIFSYILIITGIYNLIKEKTINVIIDYTTNTKRQIFVVALMITLLFALFYFPHKLFLASDPKPQINPITNFNVNKPIIQIKTGLYIKSFPKFDIINNEFIMKTIVWFEFDPHQININSIENFRFENGKILKKSKVNSKIIDDKLWVYYKITVSFSSNLNYKFFPIEDHKIYLILINEELNPEYEHLISYNTDLVTKENIFTGDWSNVDNGVEFGYIKHVLDKDTKGKSTKYPVVSFELAFEKKGSRKTLAIFLPLFMVFFLSLFSLLISIKNSLSSISMSAGSTSALIFNLIAIEDMSPNVRYFTIANKVYTILLINSFVILLVNIYVGKEMKKGANTKKLILMKSYTFYISIIFILLSIYSILY